MVTSLTGKSSSYVKNPFHIKISKAPNHSNQMMSLDVISRVTRAPTDKTLTLERDRLAANPWREKRTCILIDSLMEMLIFYEETTCFEVGSDIN